MAKVLKYEGRQEKPYKYVKPWKRFNRCNEMGHFAQNCKF